MYFIYFLLWVIFNGRWTTEIVLLGLVIAALMYAFTCKFMDYSIEKDIHLIQKSFGIIQYIRILLVEIYKANITVLKLILSRSRKPAPVIVKFKTNLKTKTGKVMLANAITLTPGTITVSLKDDELVVHCLDKELAKGIEDSVFVKMIEALERTGKDNGTDAGV